METVNIISSVVSGAISAVLFHHADVMYYNSIKNNKFGFKDFARITCDIDGEKISVYRKGLPFNTLTTIMKVCSIFPIQELIKSRLDLLRLGDPSKETISGMTTGSVAALVATPINSIKVPLMTKNTNVYKTIKYIYKTRGLKGFYRGITPTISRDICGYGTYFLLFSNINKKLNNTALSSLIASIIALCVAYPFDVVRAMRQDSTINISLKECFKKSMTPTNSNRTTFIIFMTRMILSIPIGHCTYLWTKESIKKYINMNNIKI